MTNEYKVYKIIRIPHMDSIEAETETEAIDLAMTSDYWEDDLDEEYVAVLNNK